MKNTDKRYWRGLEELRNDEKFVKNAGSEFADAPSDTQYESLVDGTGSNRRDFLKVLGFGMAAVSLAACETPVKKAIPYVNKPVGEFPTLANWYASSYTEGGDYASILVKTREGRPIKIEPNDLGKGFSGIGARVHASLLGLYDNEKLRGPKKGDDTKVSWEAVDKDIMAQLGQVAAKGGAIRILSNTVLSPSTKAVIADFTSKYPTTQHVTYDANSVSALIQANESSFGKAVVPSYDFSKVQTVVSIGADFQGSWISPEIFAGQFAETRRVSSTKDGKKDMSRHYQFETTLSLTGSNADYRTAVKPSQIGLVVASLYNQVAAKLGGKAIPSAKVDVAHLDKAANDLIAAKANALVVCGVNDPAVQVIVNALNSLLGSYGTTINLEAPAYTRQGNDVAMNQLVDEIKGGKVDALFVLGANPVYDHPRGAELAAALPKVGLSVAFNDRPDETASLLKFICPAPHYLESWNDAMPKAGFYSLTQPTISLVFNTRQAQVSLLKWAGLNDDYHEYIKSYWRKNVYTQGGKGDYESFWVKSLHDGVFMTPAANATASATFAGDIDAAAASVGKQYKASASGLELALYQNVGIGTGASANNPWLQELPEPVTKACWDNFAMISQHTASELGFEQGDVVKVDLNGKAIELPVMVQPGQANGTVAVAIGFGREKAGKSADGVGKNAYPLASFAGGFLSFAPGEVTVTKTGDFREVAQTQTHNTVMNRKSVLQETVLGQFQKDPLAGRFIPEIHTSDGVVDATDLSLWNGHQYKNHSWGMVVDLNTCYGCGSCVIGCQSENNIPVVGRQEIINSREMHWMRIDRYYSSDADVEDLRGLEIASENPEVTFQPMMCQHCNNAPCETVCPVLATTHSSEGLNQMTYNRCVGTRYCANNCPYKVRRFNWFKYFDNDNFDYNFNNDLGKMVINPEVTVRSRGVIEKCSMCVQRIQEGKLTAKRERRQVKDGDINVACASACPTNAITFGDMNDAESRISKLLSEEREGRAFHMLEEINVRPQVSYLTKVRNKDTKVKVEATKEHA
ncbi:molybdopterin-containing oxidoreductase family iron-sulfur binding subunit [Dyadobacter jejuensis]|uniref:Molybdopterin-containing oxidoreductase family iron-sulfur binding subunit n=1 Tax=Dyadobacter jejuensis TaxID=1082580 RepID=A0A316ARD5_9BACT|nr:TAT-variant-translocated molybdopterin oxidoreductase [Dyadobacter jejuensis]PWJ60152.1 molybdopterin-containing oxidoreductase family iron-sulfur binding subunit [Dyadobacter jejuensis]